MTPKTLRALMLCVLSRLAGFGVHPKRHTHLAVAGWLVGRAVRGTHFVNGKAV